MKDFPHFLFLSRTQVFGCTCDLWYITGYQTYILDVSNRGGSSGTSVCGDTTHDTLSRNHLVIHVCLRSKTYLQRLFLSLFAFKSVLFRGIALHLRDAKCIPEVNIPLCGLLRNTCSLTEYLLRGAIWYTSRLFLWSFWLLRHAQVRGSCNLKFSFVCLYTLVWNDQCFNSFWNRFWSAWFLLSWELLLTLIRTTFA